MLRKPRKVLLSGVLVVIGLAAPAASALTSAAAQPLAAPAAPSHAAAPGLYHVPIIDPVVIPGISGLSSILGGRADATDVQSANWAGYADVNDTYNSVASSWTEPTANCNNSGGGGGLLGGLGLGSLFGGPSSASSFWVGLDGYTSSSVEQIGTDSDCNGSSPSYYAWYEMYPNPSVTLPSQYVVNPGDHMTALVSSNTGGTSFGLAIKDTTAGWMFSTTQTGSGFSRSSAEVIAEAPSSCDLIFCSEVPLTDFGTVTYSGSAIADSANKSGTLSSFDADQITMNNNGTVQATPSNLSPDGSAFSVTWDNS
ncbi:MAG TPA: G1 family glutamic endopeptidase [Acidimicrobiales bacterium]